jgi:hypothetical protein
MEKETFVKIQKNLAILLLSSFLILGMIPFVAVADPVEDKYGGHWINIAYKHFNLINADFKNLKEVANSKNWQTEYPKYTDRIIADSQAAMKETDSIKTNTSCIKLERAKEEFKITMEQVAQMAVAFNKAEEAHIIGNKEDELAYAKKITEHGNSYKLHESNVYDLTQGGWFVCN